MLRAACHLEAPEGGGRRKEKVGAMHAGPGISGAKGRGGEEGGGWPGVGWREGGGRAAAPWGLGVVCKVRAGAWAGSMAALQKRKSLLLSSPLHATTSRFL